MVFTDLHKVLFLLFGIYLSILDEESRNLKLCTVIFYILFHIVFMVCRKLNLFFFLLVIILLFVFFVFALIFTIFLLRIVIF